MFYSRLINYFFNTILLKLNSQIEILTTKRIQDKTTKKKELQQP